ncbi:MAG: hypothetical protein AABY22_15645 [Nanoarchaeota archaeon]
MKTNKQPPFLKLNFGAMSDKIKTQLSNQGFKYNTTVISEYQKYHDYILHLSFQNILTDKQKDVAQNKLFNKIKSHLKKANK